MKILNVLFLTLLTCAIYAQDFYDMETIQTIEVTFSENNWDQLMDNAKAADSGYILAESIIINGVTLDSVGVKYKGNSTYSANQVKNPWHIELDTYKDQDYDGYTDIKLANASKDPSFIRDVLGYHVARQYMDAPEANFANLYVNGNLIGLYANTESISKKFMNSRFGSKNNTRFKCSPPDGAGPQSNDLPNLVYLGQDSTDYYDAYELKSDAGWQELIDLTDTLANHTASLDDMLDIDRTLWMLAFDNVIVNLDSYIGQFAQNYYLYRSDYGKFLPVVWDLNESFGTFSRTGTINLNNTATKQRMTPFLHENDNQYPLVQKILSVPMYKRMYLAHMKTMLLENFEDGSYQDVGAALQATIDASVQADGNKFFTYNNFVSNLTSDVGGGGGPGGGSTPGIANLMDARADYLLGLNDLSTLEPNIAAINLSTPTPSINETITITTTVTDGTRVYLGYRNSAITAPFNRVQMFDDGTHNDGAANDGVYGIDLTIDASKTEYYIYAENDNIGMFSPRRAEFEYHSIDASFAPPVAEGLVINELMASNETTMQDQDGEFDDWIELYNNDASTIDLSGYYLTDDGTDLMQWAFPDGTVIGPNGYLIIWADGDDDQDGLHASFKLSSGGESIILVNPTDMSIEDSVDFPEQTTDVSYARIPNGTGDFQVAEATFMDNNENSTDCSSLGGDADNDGICADSDCDDSDPSIGASQPEGTACDDENASTENDVIQSDGCTCSGTPIQMGDVVINEFMTSNEATITDQDGEFEDWIELYNNGSSAVDLSGYFLSDDGTNLTKWAFPQGTSIEPSGYLVVWADEDVDQDGLHADFKLSSSGEEVILSDPNSSIVDALDYGEQATDVSYGRFPNGTGPFQRMVPTYNAENTNTSSTNDLLPQDIKVYPNPTTNQFYLESTDTSASAKIVTITDISGKEVYKETIFGKKEINTSSWQPGTYLIKSEGAVIKLIVL